jgi:farnesyl-diphosphate farnesyltransferase
MEAPVGLAYLLCRILDTVEDALLPIDERKLLIGLFLKGLDSPTHLDEFLSRAKSTQAFETGDDCSLLKQSTTVIGHLEDLRPEVRGIFLRCIHEMGEGMVLLLDQPHIENEEQLSRYCHVVAGTVGELLTGLYCLTHNVDAEKTKALWADTEAFAQGLQRVNIAKDAGKDHERKVSFIPGLSALSEEALSLHHRFCHQIMPHLQGALRYTLSIAPSSPYRQFCALPLLLAVQTLAKIAGHPEVFSLEKGPRIPREETMKLIDFCRKHAGNNAQLTRAFSLAAKPLLVTK